MGEGLTRLNYLERSQLHPCLMLQSAFFPAGQGQCRALRAALAAKSYISREQRRGSQGYFESREVSGQWKAACSPVG